jgi:hypothetical protein
MKLRKARGPAGVVTPSLAGGGGMEHGYAWKNEDLHKRRNLVQTQQVDEMIALKKRVTTLEIQNLRPEWKSFIVQGCVDDLFDHRERDNTQGEDGGSITAAALETWYNPDKATKLAMNHRQTINFLRIHGITDLPKDLVDDEFQARDIIEYTD